MKIFICSQTLLLALILSCKSESDKESTELKNNTDLGVSNYEVGQRYNSYVQKSGHCSYDSDSEYRVILTGFGRFANVDPNFSSVVAMNFASANIEPDLPITVPFLTPADFDGVVKQSKLTINGKKVAVCQIMLSVIWDLAGAIVLFEAEQFKPNLIIMTGIDGSKPEEGTIEQAVNNEAKVLNGFEFDGRVSNVIPVASNGNNPEIIPNGPKNMKLTWKANEMHTRATPVLTAKLPQMKLITKANETPGTYLCNNISYIVLYGLQGHRLQLAGGEIDVNYKKNSEIEAGFLHFPGKSKADQRSVLAWAAVIAEMIAAQM